MKRRNHPSSATSCLSFFLVILLVNLPDGLVHADAPRVSPVRTTNFADVAKQLNTGGDFYLYIGTERWASGLTDGLERLRTTIKSMPKNDRDNAKALAFCALAEHFVQTSGLMNFGALGMSSVERKDGVFYNRGAVYHAPNQGTGIIWDAFGGSPVTRNALNLMPANTVMATYGRIDFYRLLTWWKGALEKSGDRELQSNFQSALDDLKKKGIDLEALLASSAGEIGVLFTLNPDQSYLLKQPGQPDMQIPEVGAAILLKVKDNTLFAYLDSLLQNNPNILRTDKDGKRARTMSLPLPIPLKLSPTILQSNDLFVFASNSDLANDILAVRNGEKPGLASRENLQELSTDVPADGVSMHYLSPQLMEQARRLAKTYLAKGTVPREVRAQLLNSGLLGDDKPAFSYGVVEDTETGFVFAGNASASAGKTMAIHSSVVPLAILAGLLLPAVSRARHKARSVACASNLKQLTLGLIMYADDTNGQFPDSLAQLVEKGYIQNDDIFKCPQAENPGAGAANPDYLYFGKGLTLRTLEKPSRTVILADKPTNHGDTVNVAFADGHVQRVQDMTLDEAAGRNNWVIPGNH
ncbi:MAG: DUF1559 domain-containing protein [Kiritimatiellales bacterium]|nr:DUF1559 domain-containing protein [Kiritimatiellales bacterium]